MKDLSAMVKEFDDVNSKIALDVLVKRLKRSVKPLLDVISAGKAVSFSVCFLLWLVVPSASFLLSRHRHKLICLGIVISNRESFERDLLLGVVFFSESPGGARRVPVGVEHVQEAACCEAEAGHARRAEGCQASSGGAGQEGEGQPGQVFDRGDGAGDRRHGHPADLDEGGRCFCFFL